MCIRDSRRTALFNELVPQNTKTQDVESVIQKLADARLVTTCLLYTSDAADERSSVDLGGRRIIKKKTIKYHGRHRMTEEL